MTRRRPTEEESRDFKSRVRFLVEESGKKAWWWEKNDAREFGDGQIYRWLDPENTRGKSPSVDRQLRVAKIFGVEPTWMLYGQANQGRIFLSDKTVDPVVQRLEELERSMKTLLERPQAQTPQEPERAESEIKSDKHPTFRPVKKAEPGGRKRPR